MEIIEINTLFKLFSECHKFSFAALQGNYLCLHTTPANDVVIEKKNIPTRALSGDSLISPVSIGVSKYILADITIIVVQTSTRELSQIRACSFESKRQKSNKDESEQALAVIAKPPPSSGFKAKSPIK